MDGSVFILLAYLAAGGLLGGLWLVSVLRARAVARQLARTTGV